MADATDLSLDELEGVVTPYPEFDSGLNQAEYRARTKRIRDLTDHEIRVALNTRAGLQHLIPVALDRLKQDAFNDGGLYEGALLQSVLLLPREVWSDRNLLADTDLEDRLPFRDGGL